MDSCCTCKSDALVLVLNDGGCDSLISLRQQCPQQTVCGNTGQWLLLTQIHQRLVLTLRNRAQHPTIHLFDMLHHSEGNCPPVLYVHTVNWNTKHTRSMGSFQSRTKICLIIWNSLTPHDLYKSIALIPDGTTMLLCECGHRTLALNR